MHWSNSPDSSAGHVSAFAARKQAVQIPSSNRVPAAAGDGDNGSNTARKRKKTPATTVVQSFESRQQQRKKRKIENAPKPNKPPSHQKPSAARTTTEKVPQFTSVAAIQKGSRSEGASSIENVIDVPVETFREGSAPATSPDRDYDLYRRSSTFTTKDPESEGEAKETYNEEIQSDPEGSNGYGPVPDYSTALRPANRQLSNFVPTKSSVIDQSESEWTISLREGETLTLLGQYNLWIRRGAVSILGAVLHQSSIAHRVYVPSTHSLPFIRPIRNPFGSAKQQTVITVSNCSSGLRLLRQLSSRFGRIWNSNAAETARDTFPANDLGKTFQLLHVTSDDAYKRPLRPLEIPTDWQSLITTLTSQTQTNQPNAMLVCGPKGSGKSTFSRMLSNAILTKPSINSNLGSIMRNDRCIALLDIDPGQPEFSPPGEISLVQVTCCNFGPPFTHPTASTDGVKRIRSHHIGAVSPKDDPQHYLRCALDLFHHYKQLLAQDYCCPLIVNTAGWIQGAGLELIVEFVRLLTTTDVIYTSTQGPPEVVEAITKITTEAKISSHYLTSQPVEMTPRSAADLRMMQTLSYFHLDEPEKGNLRWNAKPVNEMTPLSVHYAGTRQSIYGVLLLGQELDPEFLAQVLEGCIVGLAVIEDDAALPSLDEAPKQDAEMNDDVFEDDRTNADMHSPVETDDSESMPTDAKADTTTPLHQ
ncbi:MAG: hypothetical protein Q9225_007556, partial [Loekoesia sp. 1 TL-2023]